MIKEHRRTFKVLRIFIDASLVTSFYYLLLWFTVKVANPFNLQVFLTSEYMTLPAILTACWMAAFVAGGSYEGTRQAGWFKALMLSLKAAALMLVLFSIAVFAFKIQFISRKFFGVYGLGCVALLFLSRATEYRLLAALRRFGFNTMSVLLVGKAKSLAAVAAEFKKHQDWGYRVLGVVTLDKGKGKAGKVAGYRTLGKVDKLDKILRDRVVDELVLAAPVGDEKLLELVLDQAGSAGVNVRLAMDEGMSSWNMQLDQLGSMPAVVFSPHWHNPYNRMIKGVMDFVGSLLLLLALLPLFLLVSLAILATMGRPVFFTQKRIGLHGRAFRLFKFRTMVTDAVEKQKELKVENEMSGPVFKIKNDPRVTPVGAFLRKWSLDELPQILNVARGELSLVGPRPLYFFEARKVPSWARRRYSVKPGITCYWQVMGRNKIGFDEWMRLDLKYVDHWSLWLDLYLLILTLPAVLLRKGAY